MTSSDDTFGPQVGQDDVCVLYGLGGVAIPVASAIEWKLFLCGRQCEIFPMVLVLSPHTLRIADITLFSPITTTPKLYIRLSLEVTGGDDGKS